MHTTQPHAANDPAQVIRRAAPRSTDPGEAGRQNTARRKIDCDGGRERFGQASKGGSGSPSRETPRHHR